jgi:proton-dependent oligopeptide transporter, POT family
MKLFDQPKAVFLLSFVQLWSRFSHFGMRALLLLYMIKMLKFEDPRALGIFAVYCALVELSGVFGAYLAEEFLGLRRAVMLGGWLIGIGHLCLALEFNFFAALAFIIVGSSLYITNVATLLGDFYEAKDERREPGFTLFCMAFNGGAFAATLLCGFIAERYGWHLGFGLAAIGMVISNLSLLCFRSCLENRGAPPLAASRKPYLVLLLAAGWTVSWLTLQAQQIATPIMPWVAGGLMVLIIGRIIVRKEMERAVLASLILSLAGFVIFFAAEELICSSVLLFADRMGNQSISAMSLLAINPLVIIAGGALSALLLSKLTSPVWRILLPFALAAGAFGAMACGAVFFTMPGSFPLLLIAAVIAVISFAELLIGPLTYSNCSEVASACRNPYVMALLFIGFSLAVSLGGVVSKTIAGEAGFDPSRYGTGFALLAIGLLAMSGGLAFVKHRLSVRSFLEDHIV